MFAAVLCVALLATTAVEVEEVWEGTLQAQFAKQKKKKGPGKISADQKPLTLRLVRKGSSIQGEWIEGKRSLIIKGYINGKTLMAQPTAVKRGEWKGVILRDMRIRGEIRDDQMTGMFYGAGAKQARGGEFSVHKKLASGEKRPAKSDD
jgi:hypothetical protein